MIGVRIRVSAVYVKLEMFIDYSPKPVEFLMLTNLCTSNHRLKLTAALREIMRPRSSA